MDEEISKGKFREDLYYRLQVVQIQIPDVKDRPEDILTLLDYFVQQHLQKKITVSPAAQKLLLQYDWPGNVREIKNTAELAVFHLKDDMQIEPEHLNVKIRMFSPRKKDVSTQIHEVDFSELDLPQQITLIRSILRYNGGNLSKVAKTLGISRMTLYRKLRLENH